MTELVGILNLTPDSFSDGGKYIDTQSSIGQAQQLFADGATLVDIGAESTRPGATPLTDEQEWQRLEPVLQILIPKYPGKLSLDSYHPVNVERALRIGPIIINDVTGFRDPEMIKVATKYKPTVIISHLPDMTITQTHKQKPVTNTAEIKSDLLAAAQTLQNAGIPHRDITLDPGIGFGKSPELNWELLKFATLVLDYDVMIGYSRKRFLGEDRFELAPNINAGKIASRHGAKYLRVHDVAGHIGMLEGIHNAEHTIE